MINAGGGARLLALLAAAGFVRPGTAAAAEWNKVAFEVLSAQWGPAVSKNPFIEFNFMGGQIGDKIELTWTDNKGDQRTDEATIN